MSHRRHERSRPRTTTWWQTRIASGSGSMRLVHARPDLPVLTSAF